MAEIYNDKLYRNIKSSFVFFNTYVDVTLNSFQNACCFFFLRNVSGGNIGF